MNEKGWVLLFLYIFLVYACVHAFTVSSVDNFYIEPSMPDGFDDNLEYGDKGIAEVTEEEGNGIGQVVIDLFFSIPIIGDILKVITSLFWITVDFFDMVLSFLTFNIVGSGFMLSDGSTVPVWLSWIPFLMVVVPELIIMIAVIPYAIKFIHAVVGAIKVPFAG